MRRTAARIGTSAVIALATGLSLAAVTPPANATPTALIAPDSSEALLMNYAINLATPAQAADIDKALRAVSEAGGTPLASYPDIGTLFAQSESASFARDLAKSLEKIGVALHSVGPTRVAPVPEKERAPREGTAQPDTPQPASNVEAPASSENPAITSESGGAEGTLLEEPNESTQDGDKNPGAWAATALSVTEAGAIPVAHAPVSVGIIDTGIDDAHPDLARRVDTSRSVSCAVNGIATQSYGSWRDDYYHGTHVAGIVAAAHNGMGTDGVAPDATLVAIRAANSEHLFYPEYVTCAHMWAARHGIDVINDSYSMDPWMYWSPTDATQAAGLEAATRSIAYARSQGIAIIASAGNEGASNDAPATDDASPTDTGTPAKGRSVTGSIKVPAMVEGVSAVAALRQNNWDSNPEWARMRRAEFSNWGTSIDFAAPGERISSTVPTSLYSSGYATASGTSMAAAHVSGLAALAKSVHPAYTGEQVISLLKKQGAIDYTRLLEAEDGKEYRGYGFINATTVMRRDQMQPTVLKVQYSTDREDWKDLEGARLSGRIYFRAEAAAPISHLHMDVAGLAGVDRPGSGKYGDEPLSVSAESVDLASLLSEGTNEVSARVQVSATGINYDRQADDDTGATVNFTVVRDGASADATGSEEPAAPSDLASSSDEASARSITAPARRGDQLPANYAVNLAKGTSHETFQRAVAAASNLHGVVLGQYEAFSTFFVQAASPTFSPDLGAALKAAGIAYDSVGPTRQAPVAGNEAIVPIDYATRRAAAEAVEAAPDNGGGAQDAEESQWTPDPQTNNGWHLQALRALEAQNVDVMRAPVTVGIMDQSIDDTVPDLVGQVDHDKSVSCAVNGIPDRDPQAWRNDDALHGTHVAGSIVAKHDGVGVDGVNPTLRVAAITVASKKGGYFYPEYIACGFVWAADHGISVTNGSYFVNPWKYWVPDDPEQAAGLEAIVRASDYATSKDVINVVAAGNWTTDLDNPPTVDDSSPDDNWNADERPVPGGVYLPSMLSSVVPVSALELPEGADPATGILQRTSWSNWGATTVDFAAPGAKIYAPLTSWYGKAYGNLYGTSQAAPLAAGVIATLRQVHPDMNASQILELAKKQAHSPENWGRLKEPEDGKEYRGAGLPNALDAVLKDQPRPQLGELEYSTDGSQWKPLAGASVSGRISVRALVSGPATSATLTIGDTVVASGAGTGDFASTLMLQADGVDVAHLEGAHVSGSVKANLEAKGRNNDERADDDVAAQVSFTVTTDLDGPAEAGEGQWVSSTVGWWWRNADGTYPTSTLLRINGQVYYFDARGYVATGWRHIDGQWAYFAPSGTQMRGWVSDRGTWYYLDPFTGYMRSGWVQDRGQWYYLRSSGAMMTGWLRQGTTWYLLTDSGAMARGWVRDRSSWYYLDPESGRMQTGWLWDGGSWYYLGSSGAMVTGGRWIDGTWQSFGFDGRWQG